MTASDHDLHHRKLERMYAAAPFNGYYSGKMSISEGAARLEIPIQETFLHAAQAVHGTHYFKVLDDSCFFAAQSAVADVFLLTASFTLYFTRPIVGTHMVGDAKLVSQTRTQLIAEGVVLDETGKICGRGSGLFARSKHALETLPGYS